MAIRAEDIGAKLKLVEQPDGAGLQPEAVPANDARDWRLLFEREQARAEAAEARAEEFRCAEVRTRFESASWKHRYELSRRKLARVVEDTKATRRTADKAQSLQGSQNRKDTIKSLRTERGGLRKEVTRLNRDLTWLETRLARQTEKSETDKKTILRLDKEDVRLRRELRGLRDQDDVVRSLNEWLAACAGNGGQAPADLSKWLPWSMTEARKRTPMTLG